MLLAWIVWGIVFGKVCTHIHTHASLSFWHHWLIRGLTFVVLLLLIIIIIIIIYLLFFGIYCRHQVVIEWTFSEALYFSLSTLSAGGMYSIPQDSSDIAFALAGTNNLSVVECLTDYLTCLINN